MPKNVTHDSLFIGTDAIYPYQIRQSEEPDAPAVDVATWALSWKLKRSVDDLDNAALVSKATGSGISIVGTFNADPAINTQRIHVAIADTDTDGVEPGQCVAELKRTNDGLESILVHGPLLLRQAVHRS